MAGLALRAAEPADIAFIRALEQRDDYAAFIYRWSQAEHEATLAAPDKRTLIGADDLGASMGFAILRDFGGDRVPYLVRMAVVRPGEGLGRALLAQVCDWVFAESAAPRLELDVFEDNLRAQALYRRLGFVEDRVSEEPVGRPSGQPARLIYMSRVRDGG